VIEGISLYQKSFLMFEGPNNKKGGKKTEKKRAREVFLEIIYELKTKYF